MEADNNPNINETNVETTVPAPQGEPKVPATPATETTVMHRDIAEWHGRELIDCDGERIGKLEEVYFDVETEEPQFATMKEGLFGRHLTLVPLAGVTIGPDSLQVSVSKEQIRLSPNLEVNELSQADESRLYHHYELNYTPSDTESGRRLARR